MSFIITNYNHTTTAQSNCIDMDTDFDFSELDENHELYDTINKKIIGKRK